MKRGLATALGAGAMTGGATTFGETFHSLPFVISNIGQAFAVGRVVAIELSVIAWVRYRFLKVTLRSSLIGVTLGGGIMLAIGLAIGSA